MSNQFVRQEMDEWNRVRNGLRFPAYAEASAELAAEVESHNAEVAGVSKRLADATAAIEKAIENVDQGGEFGDFTTAMQQSQLDRGLIVGTLGNLWAERERLADLAYAEFSAAVPNLEFEYGVVLSAVKADLESIGCGVAAMPAYGVNGETAEHQRDYIAANRNTKTAAAAATLANVKSLRDAASDQRRLSAEGRVLAQKFASKLARKLAAF